MMNIHKLVSSKGIHVEMETLIYSYPYSLVKLVYNVGLGNKIHYAYVGFDSNGQRYIKTKNEIHNKAKEVIKSNYFNVKYINKWSQLN